MKERIYDSTITIVLISPNMKDAFKWDKSQWIPWEIAYSIRETTRGDFTSHSNAILIFLFTRYHKKIARSSIDVKKSHIIMMNCIIKGDQRKFNIDKCEKNTYYVIVYMRKKVSIC